MARDPMLDKEFLRQLDLEKNKTIYGKIILLTLDEQPIEEVQGKITTGSVNVDGASAIRRTCSLTMVAEKVNINNTYWAIKNKFKLEVGLKNDINPQYPNIIWFKQGTFVFTSLNMSVQSNNFTISLSGKDKMCLLNGEIGGMINASTDFGQIEDYSEDNDGEVVRTIVSFPIVDIIKNAVHVYGNEPLHNIVINDVENYGLELLEYRVSEANDHPLYLMYNVNEGAFSNLRINGVTKSYYIEGQVEPISLQEVSVYYNLNNMLTDDQIPTSIYPSLKDVGNKEKEYYVSKIENNATVGYRQTDLTYPGDLIANVGENLVTVLDKIKNMFNDFEYFYDIDGRFVFQKKQTFVNTSWSTLKMSQDEIYAADAEYSSSSVYSFEEGVLLTAFSNVPTITDVKNDFSIWGKKKSSTGQDLPVHLRYAIDFKPKYYKAFDETEYYSTEWIKGQDSENYNLPNPEDAKRTNSKVSDGWDWRELIYQMALDYFKYNHIYDDFTQQLAQLNPTVYPSGRTGYEYYYTDMQGFWRQLYCPDLPKIISLNEIKGQLTEIQFNNLRNSKYLYILKDNGDPKIKKDFILINFNDKWDEKETYYSLLQNIEEYNDNGDNKYWNKAVQDYPESLNFWFDFMDVNGEQGKYSITAIGHRPKAVNDNAVTAIYYKEAPEVLFLNQKAYANLMDNLENYAHSTGYTYIRITPEMENYFTISGQGKSAWDQLNTLLYQHLQMTEQVTLTSIPIFHLQPNIRVFIKDNNTNINGEYVVSKISIPLTYNGTSSITATKAVERIY